VGVAITALVLLLTLLPPAASADTCPNERLRQESNIDPVSREPYSAELPDCRAYELASPPFKFGLGVRGGENRLLDGSHVVVTSRGAFAEPGSNLGTLGAEYILGRGEAAGWTATGVNTPAAEFSGAGGLSGAGELVDVSRDFARGLIASDPIGSTPGSIESKPINLRFYIREPNPSEAPCASGAIAIAGVCLLEVGPAVPPATVEAWKVSPYGRGAETPRVTYRGASPDLGHVLFSTQAPNQAPKETSWLWPGDTTTYNESLYQLDGLAGTPHLVGLGNGPEPKLISQCGTDLGSPGSGNTHNALAAQGSVVFFTAKEGGCLFGGTGPKVAELYARIGGSATLAISEPPLSVPGRECTGACETAETVEGNRREGSFVGASADGTKVFFLTRQPLVNGDEEGTGAGQDLYEAELEGGAIKSLVQVSHDPNAGEAAEVQGVLRVSNDASRVYFVAHGVLAGNHDTKGETALAGAENLYVYEPDPATPGQFKIVFIASLSPSDESDWGAVGEVEVTPDGRFLLLASRGDLTPDTTAGEGSKQLYRYDAQQEKLVRVSIDENFNNNQEESEFLSREKSQFFIEQPLFGRRSYAGPRQVAISDDGAYVFFQSDTALTPRALNKQVAGCFYEEEGRCTQTFNANNVYEYHEGHVYLISDGQDRHSVEKSSTVKLIGASPSGADVYFATADPLVAQDTDTQKDLYDARINGGFPAPPAPTPCRPDQCQGELSPPPSFQSPGSLAFSGLGDLPAPAAEPPAKPTTKPLTRAQKRERALRACRRYHNRRNRNACVKRVDRRYGARSSARYSRPVQGRGR